MLFGSQYLKTSIYNTPDPLKPLVTITSWGTKKRRLIQAAAAGAVSPVAEESEEVGAFPMMFFEGSVGDVVDVFMVFSGFEDQARSLSRKFCFFYLFLCQKTEMELSIAIHYRFFVFFRKFYFATGVASSVTSTWIPNRSEVSNHGRARGPNGRSWVPGCAWRPDGM